MLKLTLFEVFMRVLPEAFIFIFTILAFAKVKVSKKNYVLSSSILCLAIPFVRFLPINYGVHVIINLILLVSINVVINKLEVISTIKASIILTVISFILEGINILCLSLIFGDNFESIISNPTLKTILGLPSLILLLIISLLYYKYTNKLLNKTEAV